MTLSGCDPTGRCTICSGIRRVAATRLEPSDLACVAPASSAVATESLLAFSCATNDDAMDAVMLPRQPVVHARSVESGSGCAPSTEAENPAGDHEGSLHVVGANVAGGRLPRRNVPHREHLAQRRLVQDCSRAVATGP